jgi:hypothetical protein
MPPKRKTEHEGTSLTTSCTKVQKASSVSSASSAAAPAASKTAFSVDGKDIYVPDDVEEIPAWLGKVALSVEDWFAVGGRILLEDALCVTFTDGSVADFSGPLNVGEKNEERKIVNIKKTDLYEALLKQAEVSPFGHGKETKIDSSVRDAHQIPASKIESIKGLPLQEILDEVRQTLVPGVEQIQAELLKLNMYEKGGHFVTHRDTPLGTDVVGSLVVCLPTAHSGGCLEVQHRGEKINFFFDQALRPPYGNDWYHPPSSDEEVILCGRPLQGVAYAAFFGDALHKVNKVGRGTRTTLSYVLRRVGPNTRATDAPSSTVGPSLAQTTADLAKLTLEQLQTKCEDAGMEVSGSRGELRERLTEAEGRKEQQRFIDPRWCSTRAIAFGKTLRAALARPDFMKSGGTLAFPCMHLYEQRDQLPSKLRRPMRFADVALRGMDAIVGVMCARAGLEVQVCHMVHVSSGVEYMVKEPPTLVSARQEICEANFSPADGLFEEAIDLSWVDLDDTLRTVTWCFERVRKEGVDPNHVVVNSQRPTPALPVIEDAWVSCQGYFGNQASIDHVYVWTVLLVTIPTADDRDLASLSVEEEPVVQVGGMPAEEENEAWRKLREFNKGPEYAWIVKDQLISLADAVGVSTEGSTGDVRSRLDDRME